MKRNPIKCKSALALPAALFLTAGFGASAQTISPATGEPPANPLPYILAAVGIVAIILVVVLMALEKKKKNHQPPSGPASGGQSDDAPVNGQGTESASTDQTE